jgi:hypothetical protein
MKDSSNSLYDCVGTLVQMQIDDGTPAAAATVGDGLLVIVCDCSLLIVLVVVNVWKGAFLVSHAFNSLLDVCLSLSTTVLILLQSFLFNNK